MKKIFIALILSISTNCFACEILVLNRADIPTNSDWQRYDPVCVKPDGFNWGDREALPKFYIVKLPQITVTQGETFLIPNITLRRKKKLDYNNLSTAMKNELNSTGMLTLNVSFLVASNYLKDK